MVARWIPNPKVRVQILYGLPKKDLTVVPPACYTKGIVKLMMMNPFGVTMKRNEMRKPKTIINYRDRVTQQEKNVDSRIVSTRPTHKVKGVEVIDGVEYYVLSV